MFGNLPFCVIKNPAGTYSYVGTIPTCLASVVKADRAAVMGGRAFKDENGELVTFKFPVFPTMLEAVDFAVSHGHTPRI